MNDDLLRQRLAAAVADVHPTPRLDEVVAGRRRPGRGPQVLAVAAVILVLGAIAVVVATRGDRTPTTVTERPPATTTTTGPRRATLGDAVAVPKDLLPAGFQLIRERALEARIGGGDPLTYWVLEFAASPEAYASGGPAIRVAQLPDRAWVSQARLSALPGADGSTPDYGEVMRAEGPYVPPGTDEGLPVSDGPWTRYERSLGRAALILVDGRQVDDRTLERIAREAELSG